MVIKLLSVISVILTFSLPVSSSYFSMIVLSIFFFIGLLSLYYLFMYFYTIPESKQSILIFLTQLLIIAHGLVLINRFLLETLIHCFITKLASFVDDNLEMVCYLRQTFNLGIPWLIIIIEIMVCRTVLKMAPVVFLGMNVLKFKLVCAIIPIVIFSFVGILSQSCNMNILVELIDYSVPISEKTKNKISMNLEQSFPLVMCLAVLLLILELINTFLCGKVSSVSKKSKVSPVNPVTIVTNTERDNEEADKDIEHCDQHDLHLVSVAHASEENSYKKEKEAPFETNKERIVASKIKGDKQTTSSICNECSFDFDNKQENDTSEANEKIDDKTIENTSSAEDGASEIVEKVDNKDLNSDKRGNPIKQIEQPNNQVNAINLSKSNTLFSKIKEKGIPTKLKLKTPVSYGFVLMMAIVLGLNIVLKYINTKFDGNNVVDRIAMANFRIIIFNSPFLWLLSHPAAKKFAVLRLKRNIVNVM